MRKPDRTLYKNISGRICRAQPPLIIKDLIDGDWLLNQVTYHKENTFADIAQKYSEVLPENATVVFDGGITEIR